MKFTLISALDGLTHVHRAGCRDIERTRMNGMHTVEAPNVEQVVRDDLADEMAELGYTEDDYHILPCSRNV